MSFTIRHTDQEIEQFVQNRASGIFQGSGAGVSALVGFILAMTGGFIYFIFFITGLLEVSPTFVGWIPLSMLLFGLLMIFLAINGRKSKPSEKKTSLPKYAKYREILRNGSIVTASIDNVYLNYGFRLNDVPKTTFYLDMKSEKIQFDTYSPFLVSKFQYEKEMVVYYNPQYPDTIVPYEIVIPPQVKTSSIEYRKVSL